MSRLDFTQSLYNQPLTREELIRRADAVASATEAPARLIPFSSTRHPREQFPTSRALSQRVHIVHDGPEATLFQMDYRIKVGKTLIEQSGRFFTYVHPDYPSVYVALSLESGEFVRKHLTAFIRSHYPSVNLTFISHRKLKKLLESFQSQGFSDLVITRAAQRLRFEGAKGTRDISMVSWPGYSLDQAFEWVHEHNGWFNTLEFSAKRESGAKLLISVSRQGIVKTDALLGKIITAFVDPVCKTIHNNLELFAHRSRSERSDLEVRPLLLDFGGDQFEDVAENAKFIKAMRRYSTSSVSIVHGNPYLHMCVIDYFDGSTFDLWVLRPNELVIVPQLQGSYPAIKRLINHIFDAYAEGDIRDYSEKQE
jgi:hypothetical protein